MICRFWTDIHFQKIVNCDERSQVSNVLTFSSVIAFTMMSACVDWDLLKKLRYNELFVSDDQRKSFTSSIKALD